MPLEFPPTHLQLVVTGLQKLKTSSAFSPIPLLIAIQTIGFSSLNNGAAQAFTSSTTQYGLWTRDYSASTVTLTPIAQEILKNRPMYEEIKAIAFTPKLFQWLLENSNNNLHASRLDIKNVTQRLNATAYEVAVIVRAYYNTLRYLNKLQLGLL